MLKTITLGAALLSAATQTAAAQVGIFSSCHGRVACTTFVVPLEGGAGLGKVIYLPPGDPARIIRWENFCKPTGEIDAEGVTRMRYAHPGCEHGRTE